MEEQIVLLEKFVSQYSEIEINLIGIKTGIFEIEYGWSDYEESETNTVTLDLNTFLLTAKMEGYSVHEGEYEDNSKMQFVDWNDLYANFCRGIREYFNEE